MKSSSAPDADGFDLAGPGALDEDPWQAELDDLGTARELLLHARSRLDAAAQAERDLLRTAARFCELFRTAPISETEFVEAAKDPMGPCPISLAGTGAPGVTDFAVAEFGAMMGWSLGRTRDYLGQALELRHRLPMCWSRVMADDAPAWKARQIAEQTKLFGPQVAQYVDRALVRELPSSSPKKIQDTIDAALLVVDEESEIDRVTGLGNRFVTIGGRSVADKHLTHVDAMIDLADGKDLAAAITRAVRDLGLPAGNKQEEAMRRPAAWPCSAMASTSGSTRSSSGARHPTPG